MKPGLVCGVGGAAIRGTAEDFSDTDLGYNYRRYYSVIGPVFHSVIPCLL